MTLVQPALLTTGGSHPASLFRQFVRGVSSRAEGVEGSTDLKVRAAATPNQSVIVGPGNGFVIGRVSPTQGTYYASNPDDATRATLAGTGSNTSQMVILRVQDPQFEGTKTPGVDMNSFDVVSCSAGATTVPGGSTAIPLARIDLVGGAGSTVSNSNIVDLRKMALAREHRDIQMTGFGTTADGPISGSVWTDWPVAFTSAIPIWATHISAIATLTSVVNSGNANLNAFMRLVLGSLNGANAVIDIDALSGPAAYTLQAFTGGLVSAAGTPGGNLTAKTQLFGSDTAGKVIQARPGTQVAIDIQYFEKAL